MHEDAGHGIGRIRIVIHGAVQGVGFRPFIFRLANASTLSGWVSNTPQGVIIEAEGPKGVLKTFAQDIPRTKPPLAHIHSMEPLYLDPVGYRSFEIRESRSEGPGTAVVLPDIATCDDCLHELFDPLDRRYRYPFINCTNCGPRFTIIDALPYDRPNTSMRDFIQCPECLAEYSDPANRRFHAQPNACPACGPSVTLRGAHGEVFDRYDAAVRDAMHHLKDGAIVAVKGIGGFHLLCDARQGETVRSLRKRKHREEKPFALMLPSVDHARAIARLSEEEEAVLRSPEAPIVLVCRGTSPDGLENAVPAENPFLGIMLPSTPLHHMLLRAFDGPLVATSGNLSDEPICIDEENARERLNGIADAFLVHNRPIRRHADDSIVRIVRGRQQVMRRARGFAPLPIRTHEDLPPLLAVGAHLKNTIAVSSGNGIIASQHIGDLETAESMTAFRQVVSDLPRLHDIVPSRIVHDLHPDYLSTQFASGQSIATTGIQHHAAHVFACMAENELHPPVLGVSWDGTGYGTDGTIWGGEFLRIDDGAWSRCASLRQFCLPGGDAAVQEPRRTALSLLAGTFGDDSSEITGLATWNAFTDGERRPLLKMIAQKFNAPITSSAGRLFDGIASLVGLRQRVRHEGQAAMQLEWLATRASKAQPYAFELLPVSDLLQIDWRPVVRDIVHDLRDGVPADLIARGFHEALAALIRNVAEVIGIRTIVLTGGCFQNNLLTELSLDQLENAGLKAHVHQRVPMNDGGIAVGQIYACHMLTMHDAAVSRTEEIV